MTNRLNGTGKAWTHERTTVATVANQAEYTVEPVAANSFGKPLFVFRDLGNNNFHPVPYADFSHELHNQRYEFWIAGLTANAAPYYHGEKVAFFREGATQKMRVFPAPTDVRTYLVDYAVGHLDWTQFEWSDTPAMPEWSHLRVLRVARDELPGSEWEGLSFDQNRLQRQDIAASLQMQIAEAEPEFQKYIVNPNHEPISDSGYWDD